MSMRFSPHRLSSHNHAGSDRPGQQQCKNHALATVDVAARGASHHALHAHVMPTLLSFLSNTTLPGMEVHRTRNPSRSKRLVAAIVYAGGQKAPRHAFRDPGQTEECRPRPSAAFLNTKSYKLKAGNKEIRKGSFVDRFVRAGSTCEEKGKGRGARGKRGPDKEE